MTSQKSLRKNHNTAFAFRQGLSNCGAVGAIYGIIMLFFYPYSSFTTLYSATQKYNSALMLNQLDSSTINPADKYYFYFNSGDTLILLIGITIIFSVIMGITAFKFITDKKTVNVYYSLGIKRTKLFAARYCSGLILLSLGVIVPLALSALINGIYLGFNAYLFKALSFSILSLLSLVLFFYSLTAAVFSSVGTTIEGVCFTGIIATLPTIFFFCLHVFSSAFLYGCSFSIDYYRTPSGIYETGNSLIRQMAVYNPLLYIYETLAPYFVCMKRDGKAILTARSFEYYETEWLNPNFSCILAWLAIAAVLAVIGIIIFNRRKAEICGFIGTNKVMNFIGSFIFSFGIFTVTVAILQENSAMISLLAGCLAMIISSLAVNLFLTRSLKQTLKTSYCAAIQVAAAIIIVVIFKTGCFGYSSAQPRLEDIESAQISSITVDSFTKLNAMLDDTDTIYKYTTSNDLYYDYTSKEDINKVTAIHKHLIELASDNLDSDSYYDASVLIRYILKDGDVFMRYYSRADINTLEAMVNMADTDAYDNMLDYALCDEDKLLESLDRDEWDLSNTYKIIAVNSSLRTDDYKSINITSEQQLQLRKAIASDLKNTTAMQQFCPQKPSIGYIVFYDTAYFSEKNVTEEDLHNYVSFNSFDGKTVIPLNENMSETMRFIKENKLEALFTPCEANEVDYLSFTPAKLTSRYSGINFTFQFFGETVYLPIDIELGKNKIKDQEQIAELLPLTHLNYFTFNEGYVCYIHYKDGTVVRKYITKENAPNYVSSFEY